MGGVTRIFSPPKPDRSATLLQEQQLQETRASLADQQRQQAERDARLKQGEEREAARRRARAAGGAGLSLLLNDEVGVPQQQLQTKLGG